MLWTTEPSVRIHGELRRSAPVYASRLEAGAAGVDPRDGETAGAVAWAVKPRALDSSICDESAAEVTRAVTARTNAIAAALVSRVQRFCS